MIVSLALIAAVAVYGVNPVALLLLGVTWIPDVVFLVGLFGGSSE